MDKEEKKMWNWNTKMKFIHKLAAMPDDSEGLTSIVNELNDFLTEYNYEVPEEIRMREVLPWNTHALRKLANDLIDLI